MKNVLLTTTPENSKSPSSTPKRVSQIVKIAVIVAYPMYSSAAIAHHGSIEICNESGAGVNVAAIYRDGLKGFALVAKDVLTGDAQSSQHSRGWSSFGWISVDPGECSLLLKPASNLKQIHLAFKAYKSAGGAILDSVSVTTDEKYAYSSSQKFCVDLSKPFSREGTLSAHKSCLPNDTLVAFPVYLVVPTIPNNVNKVRKVTIL